MQTEMVSFIDSSGLGALVRLVHNATSEGRHIRLCAVPERIRRAIDLTHLTKVFDIYPTEGDAIVAAYMGPRYASEDCAQQPAPVLCVMDSANIRSFLAELFCHAGYRALSVANLHDAQILMKATKARLIVLVPKMHELHGVPARPIFDAIDPGAELVPLDASFAGLEPGEASTKILNLLEVAAQKFRPSQPAGSA